MSIFAELKVILANTYQLQLKTQNYHWHVKGVNFKPLHDLFEEQYTILFEAVDEVAERIRILGETTPATFSEFNQLKTLEDGKSDYCAKEMLEDLYQDHQTMTQLLSECLEKASSQNDEGSVALISERIASHEKMAWFLKTSV